MKFKINKEYEKLSPRLKDLNPEKYEKIKKSIKEKGIQTRLHVKPDFTVLCGHDRIHIAQELGIPDNEIPYDIIRLNSETEYIIHVIEDNLDRKHLNPAWQIELASKLEPLYKEQAKERQKELGKNHGKDPSGNFTTRGKTRDILGDRAGVSGRTYDKGIKIKSTKQDVWDDLLKGKKDITIHSAYKDITREEKKEEILKAIRDKAINYNPKDDDIQIKCGDFRELCKNIQDDSVDFILTDPPYAEKYLQLYEDLAIVAKRVLKPGSFCISYVGHMFSDRVAQMMSKHLKLYWTASLKHKGKNAIVHERNVICEFKPVVVYCKPPEKKVKRTWRDVLDHSSGREKDLHIWQQDEGNVQYLVDYFSEPGDLVLDPMAGSGTVPFCCKRGRRKCIAIDIDPKCIPIMKGRVSEEKVERNVEHDFKKNRREI